MRGIRIPQYEFSLKMQGGLMREGGGAYLRDTTVLGIACRSRVLSGDN